MKPMRYKGYSARIEYSDEDGCFVGRVAGIRDLLLNWSLPSSTPARSDARHCPRRFFTLQPENGAIALLRR